MSFKEFKNIVPQVKLSSQPAGFLKFFVSLKNTEGKTFHLADPKATRALLACMDMEAVLNGAASHWGGPAGFAEIMSALQGLIFDIAEQKSLPWFDLFHVINDAGHCENGLYALKANYGFAGLKIEDLKNFRSLKSKLTGHGEAHLFPQGVYLSNGPLGSTLAQAQGLAMADKLLKNQRITVATLSDGACMEGEAKEALTAIPGFAKKNQINPFLLIISDNNTKLTGRIDKDSYSMEPFFKSLSTQGWKTHFIPQGNDLKTVFDSLSQAFKTIFNNPQQPLAFIFKTCKGFGVKKTMEDCSGGHGFPLKKPEDLPLFVEEIYGKDKTPKEILNWLEDIKSKHQNKALKPEEIKSTSLKKPVAQEKRAVISPVVKTDLKKVQVGVSKAFIEQKQQGIPLVSLSADLQGSTGLGPFRKTFPESSFDLGVAEANMISVAVGFSKQGFVPVVDTFSQFAVTKGALPLIMAALSQAPIMAVFSHAGFQDAADGASHQALSYFAKTCSLPHTKVYALSCATEAYHLVSQAVKEFYKEKKSGRVPKSSIFFLGREVFPDSFSASSYDLNTAQMLWDNSQDPSPVLIVTSGPLVNEALMAGEQLKAKAKGFVIINSPCVSDPDLKTISKWLKVCKGRLLTVEEHQIKGGMASQLVLALKEQGEAISLLKVLAVRGTFGRSAYKALDLYKHFGLDRDSIVKAVFRFF